MGAKRFLILSLFTLSAWAGSEGIYEKYKPAVVKISEFQQGIATGSGSGFFVSDRGHFVTNFHVVSHIADAGFSYTITLADGTVFGDIKVSKCISDSTDVCLLKIEHKPQVFFKIAGDTKLQVGQELQTIGHPKGYDFSYHEFQLLYFHRVPALAHCEGDETNCRAVRVSG